MPEDVGDQPYQNGEEPDDRTAADDAFASVVFDESFVRAALIHEPSAAERILAAAQSPSDTETARLHEDQYGHGRREDSEDAEHDPDEDDRYGRYRYGRAEYPDRVGYTDYVEDTEDPGYDGYGEDPGYTGYSGYAESRDPRDDLYGPAFRPYRGHVRWQRPVAWVLAVVMGVGIVALAFAAVYRGAATQRQQTPVPPPATTGVDAPPDGRSGALPSLSTPYMTSSARHTTSVVAPVQPR